jgi:hypothetical protein
MFARLEEEKLHDEPELFLKATIYIGTFCNCFQGFSVYIAFTLQTVKRDSRLQRGLLRSLCQKYRRMV